MMPEISLNILDVAENSTRAKASLVTIIVDVQTAAVHQGPEGVALGEGAAVFTLPVQNGQGRIPGRFHAGQCLAQGVVCHQMDAAGLRRQKKEDIVHRGLPFQRGFRWYYYTIASTRQDINKL